MVRTAVTGLVISVLATGGCALVEPPPSPGTVPVRARVTNTERIPVELAVKGPTGVLAGAVQPPSLAAKATADVTFFMPPGAGWSITVNGSDMFFSEDLASYAGCSTFNMEVSTTGAGSLGCLSQ
jgi:hypothetical protein